MRTHPGTHIPEWMWREYDCDNDLLMRRALEHRFTPVDELFRDVLADADLTITIDRRKDPQ